VYIFSMRKRSRTLLFLGFVFIFVAAIPPIVFYTQGYRVDIDQRGIVKTGGIDIIARPLDALVFLDGEFKDGTNFFFRSTFLNNILPGEHSLRVEKDGYHTWQKMVAVLEGQVTKFPSVQLFPKELSRSIIATNLSDVHASPNNQLVLALHKTAPSETTSAATSLILLNMETGAQTSLYEIGVGESVVHMEWAPGSQTFYFVVRDALGEQFYTSSVGAPTRLFSWSHLLRSTYSGFNRAEHTFVVTENPQMLLIFTPLDSSVFTLDRLDADPGLLEEGLRTDIRAFAVAGNELIYVDAEQLLVRYNLTSAASEILSDALVGESAVSSAQLFVRENGTALALATNNALFVWEEGAPLIKIADNATGVRFGPDNKAVLFSGAEHVSVYWFDEVFGPPKRLAGDIETIDLPASVGSAYWYNDNAGYVVVEQPSGIEAVEVDARGGRNTTSYDLSTVEILGYSPRGHMLYGISGTTLMALSLNGQ
jgi:hypothetical protein